MFGRIRSSKWKMHSSDSVILGRNHGEIIADEWKKIACPYDGRIRVVQRRMLDGGGLRHEMLLFEAGFEGHAPAVPSIAFIALGCGDGVFNCKASTLGPSPRGR